MERNDIHAKIDEWIASEMAQGLSGEERLALSHHLEECSECRAFYSEARGVSDLAGDALAGDRPGPDFEDRMVEAFRKNLDSAPASANASPGPRPAALRRTVFFEVGKIAALLLVLVGGAILLFPLTMFEGSETGAEGMLVDFPGAPRRAPKGKAVHSDGLVARRDVVFGETADSESEDRERHREQARESLLKMEALRKRVAREESLKRGRTVDNESGKALDFFGREKLKVLNAVPGEKPPPKAPVARRCV